MHMPTCARCRRGVEAGFSLCAPCSDEERVERARRVAHQTTQGEPMGKTMAAVVMGIVAGAPVTCPGES
jgi:hypothetical protein